MTKSAYNEGETQVARLKLDLLLSKSIYFNVIVQVSVDYTNKNSLYLMIN